jgi:acid phosphatase type 7
VTGRIGIGRGTPVTPRKESLVHRRRQAVVAVSLVLMCGVLAGSPPGRSVDAAGPAGGDDHVLLAAGDIASCVLPGDEATAAALEANPGAAVAMLGDGAYPLSDADGYRRCYTPSWGKAQILERTHPATGNHEYEKPSAPSPMRPQAGDYFDYFGASAGPRPGGYYSYDLGAWHIVVLNSTCWKNGPAGLDGCTADDSMGRWLQQDLAASQAKCMIAYWHHPRFFSVTLAQNQVNDALTPSGDPSARAWDTIWRVLQSHGVDVVLSGHRHAYERFPKLRAPDGNSGGFGVPDPQGIRQFVVGTGGGPHEFFQQDAAGNPARTDPNSEKRIDGTWGVLRLTLHQESYDWQFLSAGTPGTSETPAGTVLDEGYGESCRDEAASTPGPARPRRRPPPR